MSQVVTVVLPAYQHERYVAAAIESVLGQTFEHFALLVIDDCSPDDTWSEIRRISDKRITAMRHERNVGAHATLNEALHRVSTPYVSILNSDDVYDPNRLARLVGYLEESGADLVGSGVQLIGSDGTAVVDSDHPWLGWYQALGDTLRRTGDLVATLLSGNIFVTTSNFVFRRELADRIGGFENLRYSHDYAFLLRAASEPGIRLGLLADECLLSYRWHEGNTIREDETKALGETYRLLLGAFPRLLPAQHRVRVQMALQHLLALGLPADPTPLLDTKKELAMARAEAERCRRSLSYRVGSALLWPLRRSRALLGG